MASIIQKKRFANEVKIISQQPSHYYTAYPDESNPLIWYFLLKGQRGTDYHTGEKNSEGKYVGGEGGEYIGKIVHSPKYPAEPPDYYMLTPSGRFNVGSKICLTNSSYHKGDWSSTWNILSILIAFYSIWLDDKEHGISHIIDTPANRRKMAAESIAYNKKNNAEIYAKFDHTHLKDDTPVVLKEKAEEKSEVKEEIKAEVKEEVKEEEKSEVKEEIKEVKEEVKAEKAEVKVKVKEMKKKHIKVDDINNGKIEVVKNKRVSKKQQMNY
jgi:ubiquitin-conjugating enzyme E2 J2